MQVVDASGNVFGQGLEITDKNGKPKVPVINTDITIGTTTIVGGVVGQVLFQGAGNVVQESPNITWDNTNKIFKVSTGTEGIVLEGDASGYPTFKINTLRSGTTRRNWMFATEQINAGDFVLYRSSTGGGIANTLVYSIFNDGNFGLNTSTNAGYKADINGTLRSQGTVTVGTTGQGQITAGTLFLQYPATISYTTTYGLNIIPSTAGSGVIIIDGSSMRLLANNHALNLSTTTATKTFLIQKQQGGADATSYLDISGADQTSTAYAGKGGPVRIYGGLNNGIADPGLVVLAHNGTSIRGSVLIGTSTYTPATLLTLGGSVTAASAIARGGLINTTLSAAANSDVLVGLDINPTFNTLTYSSTVWTTLRLWQDANQYGELRPYVSFKYGATYEVFRIFMDASWRQNFRSYGASGSGFNFITNTSANALTIFNTGNTGLNTATDAGFKFDCNGTARFTGAIIGPNNSSLNSIIFDGGGTRRIRPEVNSLDITDPSGNIGFRVDSSGVRVASGFSSLDFVRGLNSMVHTTSTIQKMTFTLSGQQVNHLTPFVDIVAAGYAPSAPSGNNTTLRIFTTNTTSGIYGNIIISHNGTSKTGNILIGTSTNVASAIVNVESTTQGLLFPRMSTTEKLAIATPAAGLVIFDTTLNKLCVYTTAWETITSV